MASKHDNVEKIVQSCLDMIQDGQGTIDTILAKYPELEGELRPRLESAIWLSSRRGAFDPRPGFVRASRSRLVAQIQEEMKAAPPPAVPLSEGTFWRYWQNLFRSKRLVFQLAVVLVLVVSFIIASSGVALASQSALPGEPFYSVKIALENAQIAISPSNSKDAQLRIAFAQRRLVEIQSLILEGRYEFVPQTVANFELQVDQAVKLMNVVANQNSERGRELALLLRQTLSEQSTVLQVLAGVVPQETKPEIERALKTSMLGDAAANEVIITGHGASDFTPAPLLTSTATGSPPTSSPSPTLTPTGTASLLPVLPIESTPTGSTTPISPTLTLSPEPVPLIKKPSPTPTPTPEPTKKPRPTKKPSKTPKPHPDPTRRPTKPN
jgi:hypothetical protein